MTGRHVSRDLLHRDRLIFFKKWVELTHEYEIMPPSGHAYEVLRIRKLHLNPNGSRQGDGHDIFFYQKEPPTAHVTLDKEGEALVRRWIREDRKARKPKVLDDPHFEARFDILSDFEDKKISLAQLRALLKDTGMTDEDIDRELDEGIND